MKKKNNLSVKTKKTVETVNGASEFLVKNKYALLTLGVGVLGYVAYKKITGFSKDVVEFAAPIATDEIIIEVEADKSNTSITEVEADFLAKALLEAFNDDTLFLGGTDEAKVEEVLNQLNTGDDYKMVYNAFGRRPWMHDGTPTHWIDKKFFAEEKDLNHWFKQEISPLFDGNLYEKIKSLVDQAGMIL